MRERDGERGREGERVKERERRRKRVCSCVSVCAYMHACVYFVSGHFCGINDTTIVVDREAIHLSTVQCVS